MIRFGWINSFLSAFFISLCCPCCFLQILLNLFGITCAGLNNILEPYRPFFISLTVISLTYSYIRYRPSKLNFFLIVILTLCLSFGPEIFRMYQQQPQQTTNDIVDQNVIITHWQIIGMHCDSCRLTVLRSLQNLKEILNVNVDLDSGQADIITRVIIEDDIIIQAVQSVGFQAYKII